MSYPQAPSLVWMTCQGAGYDAHHGGTYQTWVPFLEAIHRPPECHGKPRLTEGGRRMRNLAETWRERGPRLDCWFSGKGEGQGVSCYAHGWAGVYSDLTWTAEGNEDHCPVYPVAAWLTRRSSGFDGLEALRAVR